MRFPVELHAILPPGSRQLTRDLLWRPMTPGGSLSRGLHVRRFESVAARSAFALRATPGVQVVPLHAPLELGDMSSRLRVIDATLDGSTYTLRVEGRRGRSYHVRLLGPPAVSVHGATRIRSRCHGHGPSGWRDPPDRHAAGRSGAAGAVLKRTDWATAAVTIQFAPRQP